MKRILGAVIVVIAFTAPTAGQVFAAANPSGTGQPNQTCLSPSALSEPGHAGTARGSAFNENGGIAGGVYANPDAQGGLSSGNPHVVTQYDVACFQVSH